MRDRVSERARERALDRLKAGYSAGWLATDTFEARVRTALVAASPGALRGLVEDLTKPRLLERLRSWHSRRRPPLPSPGLLQDLLIARHVVLIGRSAACDLVLGDDTVSRRHAMLRSDGDRVVLTDLGSTNGTRLNGRWVAKAEVRPGDHLRLGQLEVTL